MDDGRGSELFNEAHRGSCLDTVTVTGLRLDHNYRFQLRGIDFEGLDGPWSYMVSFVSAGLPRYRPNVIPSLTKIGAQDIRVSWTMPDESGSPVLGFVVMSDRDASSSWQVLYNGTTSPNVFETTVRGLVVPSIYRYRVYAVNRVGTSPAIENEIQLSRMLAVPKAYPLSFPKTANSGLEAECRLKSVDPLNNLDEESGGRLFVLKTTNLCQLDITGVLCIPLPEDHADYRTENLLLESGTGADRAPATVCCDLSIDREDGSYDVPFTLRTKGKFSVSVQSLELGGLLAQYFDNQWFYGLPIETRQDGRIDFDWGTNALAGYAADFVSVRWTGFILPEFSEVYTFFVIADDSARLYVNDLLIFDKWGESGSEFSGSLRLQANTLVPIRLEYREISGNATAKLLYASFSTPRQIIPEERLYKAVYVSGFPSTIDVQIGMVSAARSEAYGRYLLDVNCGVERFFYIQAKDQAGNNMNTNSDSFQVLFVGPTAESNVVVNSKPVDSAAFDGLYIVFFLLTVSGEYEVQITLGGIPLGGSPFKLTAAAGAVSAARSEATGGAITEFLAGTETSFDLTVRDSNRNVVPSAGLDVAASLEWLDYVGGAPGLPLTSDTALLNGEFGEYFFGTPVYQGEGVYKVSYIALREGRYKLYVKVEGIDVSGSPFDLRGFSAQIRDPVSGLTSEVPYGPKCRTEALKPPATWQAGVPLSIRVQLRDAFGNPLSTPVGNPALQLPIAQLTTVPASTQLDTATCSNYLGCNDGTENVCNTLRGVYECLITPTFAGPDRFLSVRLQGAEISRVDVISRTVQGESLTSTEVTQGPFGIVITPGVAVGNTSRVLDLPLYYEAGRTIPVLLQWRDVFGNDLIESPTVLEAFEAKMKSSGRESDLE